MNRDEAIAQVLEVRRRLDSIEYRYMPYPPQVDMHIAGTTHYHRLLMAGNRTGKTWSGAHETAFHITGRYPIWWQGARFEHAPTIWVGGNTGKEIRSISQRYLFGKPGQILAPSKGYEGLVEHELIIDKGMSKTTTNLLDFATVRHASGGVSEVRFKSYKEDVESWQGTALDFLWLDEEPPEKIYSEAVSRLADARNGPNSLMTFTPLKGVTGVVLDYLDDETAREQRNTVIRMTIDDAEHILPERRDAIVAKWPEHERAARRDGEPMMGSGLVYQCPERNFLLDAPARIQPHWKYVIGLDFGWEHPTAAVLAALDERTDTIYMLREHRRVRETAEMTAAHIHAWGAHDVAWPHDGNNKGSGTDESKVDRYRKAGLKMKTAAVKNPVNSRNARQRSGVAWGVEEILGRMKDGRFKVNPGLEMWRSERRNYHRIEGEINKLKDDLMDATRYAVMSLMSGGGRLAPKVREHQMEERRRRLSRRRGTTWAA